MLRETTFAIGGALAIALGLALAGGLAGAGAGAGYLDAWLAAVLSVAVGVFFVRVAHDARRFRAAYRRALEAGEEPPPGGPPR